MASAPNACFVVRQDDVESAFKTYGLATAQDPAFYSHAFELIRAYWEGDQFSRFAAATGVADYVAGRSSLPKGTRYVISSASFVVSQADLTLALRALSTVSSPARAGAVAGFAVVQKVGLVQNLLPRDQRTAKCTLALMQLAGMAGLSALTPFELASIAGAGLAVLTIASLIATAAEAAEACRAPETA